MAENEHGRLIAAAAKQHLRPLGFVRKGRSRFWFRDNGYWANCVEFQPSAWSKGSYLNVAACWLWHTKDYFSFDFGGRVGNFIDFVTVEQFEPKAQELAAQAAQEASKIQEKLANMREAARSLCDRAPGTSVDAWRLLDGAIASRLSGDLSAAGQQFDELIALEAELDWEIARRQWAIGLKTILQDTAAFQTEIQDAVNATRLALKLPTNPDCVRLAT